MRHVRLIPVRLGSVPHRAPAGIGGHERTRRVPKNRRSAPLHSPTSGGGQGGSEFESPTQRLPLGSPTLPTRQVVTEDGSRHATELATVAARGAVVAAVGELEQTVAMRTRRPRPRTIRLRRFLLPTGRDRAGSAPVPALRVVVPRCRGAAGRNAGSQSTTSPSTAGCNDSRHYSARRPVPAGMPSATAGESTRPT